MFWARGLVSCQLEWIAALNLHISVLFSLTYKYIIILEPALHQSISNPGITNDLNITLYKQRFSQVFQPRKEEIKAAMISAKRLVQMAKKWQRMAALARKRLTPSTPVKETDESSCSTSSVAGKGHCVVYSADGKRFEVPLAYLSTAVFIELLRMSQEEFGFASDDSRITLPCDAAAMEYVMCLLCREASEEVERAFLSSMVRTCHYGNGLGQTMGLGHQFAVSTF